MVASERCLTTTAWPASRISSTASWPSSTDTSAYWLLRAARWPGGWRARPAGSLAALAQLTKEVAMATIVRKTPPPSTKAAPVPDDPTDDGGDEPLEDAIRRVVTDMLKEQQASSAPARAAATGRPALATPAQQEWDMQTAVQQAMAAVRAEEDASKTKAELAAAKRALAAKRKAEETETPTPKTETRRLSRWMWGE